MALERRDNLYDDIKTLLESARKKVLSTVNSAISFCDSFENAIFDILLMHL